MHTHLLASIPHRAEDISKDVASPNGDGARLNVDRYFIESPKVNTDAVLQVGQRDRKAMTATGGHERDSLVSGDFHLEKD